MAAVRRHLARAGHAGKRNSFALIQRRFVRPNQAGFWKRITQSSRRWQFVRFHPCGAGWASRPIEFYKLHSVFQRRPLDCHGCDRRRSPSGSPFRGSLHRILAETIPVPRRCFADAIQFRGHVEPQAG